MEREERQMMGSGSRRSQKRHKEKSSPIITNDDLRQTEPQRSSNDSEHIIRKVL